MVPLIVQHHDWRAFIEFAQHAFRKSVGRLLAFVHDGVGGAALCLWGFQSELVPVGYQHFPAVEQRAEFCRDKFKRIVVVVRQFGAQHLKAFFDCQVGADDQRGFGEAVVGGHFAAVAERPGNQHRHHNGFAAAGRHLAPVTNQLGEVCHFRCVNQFVESLIGELGIEAGAFAWAADFGKPDNRLNGFALAEEEAPLLILACPMVEEFARHIGGVSVIRFSPPLDIGA